MSYKISPDIPDNLIESYLSESEIAVDTELHGLSLSRDEVCLVQICDDKNNVSLIKPIIGCVLNVCEDHLNKNYRDNGYQIVFLAKNKNGYNNLSKLSSILFGIPTAFEPNSPTCLPN